MKKMLIILFVLSIGISDDYMYSAQDYNATSPTYGQDVWLPQYSDYITMHFFSSQG